MFGFFLLTTGYVSANYGRILGAHIVDPVLTDAGFVSGTVIDAVPYTGISTLIGEIGKEVRIYRGIPFAAPPVGNLRWKPPQPVPPWEGIRESTKFSLWAPQSFPTAAWSGGIPESGMGEDCLYLNVLTPAKNDKDRLPVMVWLHGGGLNASSGNMGSYNTPPLPQHGVVLVTVSHRLGAIGYLAHPWLDAESGASGNYGQLDIIAALKWVKRNISAFGGNPNNVTIFGQSGGGAKVVWLLASPLAKGLFQRAIIEAGIGAGTGGGSADSYIFQTKELAWTNGEKLSNYLGVSSLAELRSKSWQDIIKATTSPGSGQPIPSGFETRYTVDGWSLPDTIWNLMAAGKKNDVPVMIGAGEPELAKHQGTTVWAPVLLNGRSNLYVYVFSQVPSNWRNFGLKAYHGLEVAYQFGTIDLIRFHRNALFAAPPGLPVDPGLDFMDVWVTDVTMKMWARFAAIGNPSIKGVVWWPDFDLKPGLDRYLNIAYPLEVKSNFLATYPYPAP
ncbi:MAG: carboxylesterase family protein [Thermodesulfobacteriota bacterium]